MGMNLLVVDDSKVARAEIVQMLNGQRGFTTIFEARNGIEALKVLSSQEIDLIICDIIMPKMDGLKFLMSLQSNGDWRQIPIILLTSKTGLEDRVRGLELGAWDYLIKPTNPLELVARTRVMLRIKSLQDKLKNRIRQLERLSIVDGLTGVYNKKYLYEFIKREVKQAERSGLMIACVMIDVDNFKNINDVYGHPCADAVLKQLAGILGEIVRGYDFTARYGGDEFTVVLTQQTNRKHVEMVAERILQSVKQHEFIGRSRSTRLKIRVTVSLGVAMFPDKDIANYESLIERADEALCQAKLHGRDRIVFK
ncbi:MAG: diguanylate cyclase [Nitrospiria bacterium]